MRTSAILALCLSVLPASLNASTLCPDTASVVPTDSVVVSGAVDSAGTLSATVRMVMLGYRGRVPQRLMEQASADKVASDVSRLAATLSPSGKAEAVTVQEGQGLSDGYRLVFTASIPGYVRPDADVQGVRPPLPGFPLPDVPTGPQAGLLSLGLPHAVVHRTRVMLPRGLQALPSAQASDSASFARFTLASRAGGRELVDVQRLTIRKGIVPVDAYGKYRIFAATVGAASQAPFIVVQDNTAKNRRIIGVPGAQNPTYVETDWGTPPTYVKPLPLPLRKLALAELRFETVRNEPGDVDPAIRNARDVRRLLQRAYPPSLKDAGIGGRALLWLWVSKSGKVTEVIVKNSSGHEALDFAAVKVGFRIRFQPARHHGRPIGVWILQPITFESKP